MALHSVAKASTFWGELSPSAVFTARLRDLVDSPRIFRALRDLSLDSSRVVAVEEREGRRDWRFRDCHAARADWRGVRSLMAAVMAF